MTDQVQADVYEVLEIVKKKLVETIGDLAAWQVAYEDLKKKYDEVWMELSTSKATVQCLQEAMKERVDDDDQA